MQQGTTLLEAVAVLVLLGVLTGLAGPPLTRLRDRAEAHAAREALIGRIVRARAAAVAAGGATLLVRPGPPRTQLVVAGDTLPADALGGSPGLGLRGGRPVELDFDGLGLGRFANATIRLEHGGASSTVVVSSYGRASRR